MAKQSTRRVKVARENVQAGDEAVFQYNGKEWGPIPVTEVDEEGAVYSLAGTLLEANIVTGEPVIEFFRWETYWDPGVYIDGINRLWFMDDGMEPAFTSAAADTAEFDPFADDFRIFLRQSTVDMAAESLTPEQELTLVLQKRAKA